MLTPDSAEARFLGPAGPWTPGWDDSLRAISLGAGGAVEFSLPTVAEGLYLVAVHCRVGHQPSGGGWQYCMPDVRYTLHVDDQPYDLVRGLVDPVLRLKAAGWCDFSGWIVSRDFVELRSQARLRVGCGENHAYVLEVALLAPSQAAAADWLVPDAMGKVLDRVEEERTRLAAFADRAADLAEGLGCAPAFSPVLDAFDARTAALRRDIGQWQERLAAARAGNDEAAIRSLQAAAGAIRAQAGEPCTWVAEEAHGWCRGVAEAAAPLAALPSTADYHARWAGILREWIDIYRSHLSTSEPSPNGVRTARLLGRALRLLDLRRRYQREVEAAKPPAWTATGVAKSGMPSRGRGPATLCLNGVWDFSPGGDPAVAPAAWPGTIRVPHGPWPTTYGTFFEAGQTWHPEDHLAWYRFRFFVPAEWDGSCAAIRFEAVFHYADVYLNGVYCGSHLGGFDRFAVDVTRALVPGEDNELVMMVKDTRDTMTDPARNQRDDFSPNWLAVNDLHGVNYGGIWQDVYLEVRPDAARIARVAIRTPVRGGVRLELTGAATNGSNQPRLLRLRFSVMEGAATVATLKTDPQEIRPGASATWQTGRAFDEARLWGIGGAYGEPYLYRLRTELLEGERVLDRRFHAFGFSQLWIDGSRFLLNGRALFLAGGGIWYLQEGKFPLGNRFYMNHLFRLDRQAGIVIERFHRHGDISEQILAEAAEMGMLIESEVSQSSCMHPPSDAVGRKDFGDPVWRGNMRAYYRQWAAKHRNWPCLGLLSVENETFAYNDNEEMMQTAIEMAAAAAASDPLRIPDFHGNHLMADHPGPRFVNVHYTGEGALGKYVQAANGRPLVNGEHNFGGAPLVCNHDREVAARAEASYADSWRREIRGYLQRGAAGLFAFVPAFDAYCSTGDWTLTTPWGDLFKDLSVYNPGDDRWRCGLAAWPDVAWPSLSGPGTKAERVWVAPTRCTINWFDPERAVCTPNRIHAAMRETFPPAPPCGTHRGQEALVTVTSGGRPMAGVVVMLEPAEGQPLLPLGAVTDPQGTAWIAPRLPGRYRVLVYASGTRPVQAELKLEQYAPIRAGYGDAIVTRRVALSQHGDED